jgi:hypothetical protein
MARRQRNTAPSGEVYFEHITIGRAVKVSAIHAASGTEVSISGPRATSQHELERIALQKLIRAMTRNQD